MSFDLKIQNGDIAIDSFNNDIKKVENSDKLIQDVLKIVTTPLSSNKFYPWYGSPITKTLIGNVLDMEFTSNMATNQLRNSLENLQKLQKVQSGTQLVTAQELLATLENVSIERNIIDPRFYSIIVSVLNKAFVSIPTQFSFGPGI